MIEIFVEKCLVIGKQKSNPNLIEELKTYEFKWKIEKKIVDYLNLHIVESEKEKKILMLQPHLIYRLIQKFEKEKLGK
jgi:hypothetical protein